MMWDDDGMPGDRMPWDDPMYMEGGEGILARFGTWMAIAAGALVVIVAGTVGIMLYMKKKRKNQDVFEGLQ